jgi:hypothetical protein
LGREGGCAELCAHTLDVQGRIFLAFDKGNTRVRYQSTKKDVILPGWHREMIMCKGCACGHGQPTVKVVSHDHEHTHGAVKHSHPHDHDHEHNHEANGAPDHEDHIH